jgi:hypothetical protein
MIDARRYVRRGADDEPETMTTRGSARTDTQPVADRSVTDDRRS